MATMETMRDDDDGAAVVGRGLGLCERRAGSSGAVMKPRPRIEKRSLWRNNYSSKALDCLVEVALSPTAALDLSGRNNAGESVATLRTDKHSTTTTPSRADGEGDEAKGKGKDNDDDDSAAMGRYWSWSSAMKPPEPAAAAMTPSPSPSPASSLNHRAATGFYQQQQQHQQQEQQQKEYQKEQQKEQQQKEHQKEQQKEQQQERQREQKLKMKRGLSSSSWSGMSSHRAGRSSSSSSLRVHADQPHSKRFTPRFKSLLDISC